MIKKRKIEQLQEGVKKIEQKNNKAASGWEIGTSFLRKLFGVSLKRSSVGY